MFQGRIFQKVFLVVILSKDERLQGYDIGPNSSAGALFQSFLGCHGLLVLFLIVIKDRIFVLHHARLSGVIVAVPQDIKQLTVGDLFRVKIHLHCFGMVADTFIGW